jgi:heat shock protein HslJ
MNKLLFITLVVFICLPMPAETFSSAGGNRQIAGSDDSWLDRAPVNWNERMSPLPRPITSANAVEIQTRCPELIRQPESDAENALVRVGWMLYGEVQSFEHTKVIFAMSDVDGMCRPLGYQAFVYWEGRYAGTLSPIAMNSRTDGALTKISLAGPTRILAEFARYTKSDPLCCPTRISHVTYDVNREDFPLVTPLTINTLPVETGGVAGKPETASGNATLFFGKKWRLTEVDGAAIKTTQAYIEFDREAKRVSGDSGCNRITGGFRVDGANLTFFQLASTRRACLDGDIQRVETNFLKRLEQTTTFQIQRDTMHFYAGDNPILTFKVESVPR